MTEISEANSKLENKLEKCYVYSKSKKWHIAIRAFREELKEEDKKNKLFQELEDFRKNLLEEVSNLKDVSFVLVPGEDGAPTEKELYLDNNKEVFFKNIQECNPSLYGCLKNTKWKFGAKEIRIIFNNHVNKELSLKKGAKNKIEDFFSPVFEEKPTVKVAIKEEKEQEYIGFNSETIVIEESKNKKQEDVGQEKSPPTNGILLGKSIKGEVTSIREIQEEEKSIIIEGKIFSLDVINLKSGRKLVIFYVTDHTDSLIGKFFLKEKEEIPGDLQEGIWVKVRGNVITDQFEQELTMQVKDMVLSEAKDTRKDKGEKKRVELHAHTKMSALDCTCSASDLIKRAAKWGHEAIAITDHGVVQSFPEAFEAALENNIKVIYGVEAYIVESAENYKSDSYHCIVLAKNKDGLKDLYELITRSHTKYFYKKPRIPKTELNKVRENLIIGSACEAGEIVRAIMAGKSYEELKEIASFYDYLEIQPPSNNEFMLREGILNSRQELNNINIKIVELAKELSLPFCATGDIHFLEPWDEVFRKILMAGQGFSDITQPPLYFKATDEILEEFNYLGEKDAYQAVIENPALIAGRVDDMSPIPDDLYTPEIPGAEENIRDMTHNKAKELYGDPLPELVESRIEEELESIIDQGYAVIYYISHKLTKKSLEDGYLVGSRGSVGSSLVATLCEITEVNPLPPHYRCPGCKLVEFINDGSVGSGVDLSPKKCPDCGQQLEKDGFDIPFAVFMGFRGEKVPDIDLNFSGEYQPVAHEYIEELFGKDCVYRAGTIGTIAKKTAYGFVRGYFNETGEAVRKPEIERLVDGCTGTKRTTGQHPGGLMIVPQELDIHQFCPVQYPADNKDAEIMTTHFDYGAISSRLLKLDVLGHDVPTIIHMLEGMTGVNALEIPLDEEKTMELFSNVTPLGIEEEDIDSTVGTLGIPEFGTSFVRQMLVDTRPESFSELVRISGLSHGTDVWLNNAQDLVSEGKAELNEVISTRDDIMVYLMYKGVAPGTAFTIMERVRKSKGLSEELLEAMKEVEVPEWYIDSCLKIKYLFPKAHAVAYTMMSYRIAYFKVYYPEAFYAAFFTVKAEDFDANLIVKGSEEVKKRLKDIEEKGDDASPKEKSEVVVLEVAREMYARGVKVHPVDIYASHSCKFKLTEDNKLLPPLVTLKGLGLSVAMQLEKKREEMEFLSVEDLKKRCKVPKTALEVMREHGCLEKLPENNQLSLF